MKAVLTLFTITVTLTLAACGSGAGDSPPPAPGTADAAAPATAAFDEAKPYDGIAPDEQIEFTGTEPFWGGQVSGRTLTYKTPDDLSGRLVEVERFAGRGGISFSGMLDGVTFVMALTPSTCSDGMSDRSYPFTVTLRLGEETRSGCGWTDRQPFTGPPNP
jgi:uncharacterized membrane protein